MGEELSNGKRIFFTAVVIASIFVILKSLYHIGYTVYTLTDVYLFDNNVGYTLYSNRMINFLVNIFSYAGLAAVWVLWKAPKPRWHFIWLAVSLFLPKIASEIISLIYSSSEAAYEHGAVYSAISSAVALGCMALFWVVMVRILKRSAKDAKGLLALYMIQAGLGYMMSIMLIVYIGPIMSIVYPFVYRALMAAIAVMTIVYLKRQLRDDMPLTKTLRWIKEECTNHPAE